VRLLVVGVFAVTLVGCQRRLPLVVADGGADRGAAADRDAPDRADVSVERRVDGPRLPCIAGAACDDGNPCTGGDTCSVTGVCIGDTICGGGGICFDAVCDPGPPVKCSYPLKPGHCWIESSCYFAKVVHPKDPCLVCDPAMSSTSWSTAALPCVSTFAGVHTPGGGNLLGPAEQAQLRSPHAVAVDATGAIFVSDRGNHQVKKIEGGVVSLVSGAGTWGCTAGTAPGAELRDPGQLQVAPGGALLVADPGCSVVWTIDGSGTSELLAGTPMVSTSPPADGLASVATFSLPVGVAAFGGAVFIADAGNHSIRKLEGGLVSTLAGKWNMAGCIEGAAGTLHDPAALAVDAGGGLYIVDRGCLAIRELSTTTLTISRLAGIGVFGYADGPATSAMFGGPAGIAVSPDGKRVYVADTAGSCIRLVENGMVSTLAGFCSYGALEGYKDGPATTAQFKQPVGLALRSSTELLVADMGNHVIRLIRVAP